MSPHAHLEIGKIKVVSLDAEGTLVTPDFSYAIWFEAIPERYARKHNIEFELAKKLIKEEYAKVGDHRLEWYDVRYWFDKFGLGTPDSVMESHQHKVRYYPEVKEVLSFLSCRYQLVVASGSTRDFLKFLLRDINSYFSRVFSSLSDFNQVKTPTFYSEMCQALRVRPQEVIHVGDNRQFDFIAPSEIGIQTLYLDRKGGPRADRSIADLTELNALLAG
ncbi:MAG TPA: HAD family hydrolase [Dehalococcoidia bacterium]|nr:HAD family hydrolase [Dehalococcoidia bacterium]